MKCARCDEEVLDPRPVCFHCGAPIDHTPVAPRGPIATAAQFALAEQDPGYAAAWASTATPPRKRIGPPLATIGFFTAMLALGFPIGARLDSRMATVSWSMLWLLLIFNEVYNASVPLWTAIAPTRRVLAVVVEKRRHYEHRLKKAGTIHETHRTVHHEFATLETRDGKRKLLRCSPKVAQKLAAPSIGVAIIKGPYLLKFIALPVPLP